MPCPEAKVVFQNQEDEDKYDGKIIECGFDQTSSQWLFLRERVDKQRPNAYNVYEKVLKSIRDNITQEELIEKMLNWFSTAELYQKDREKLAEHIR